MAQKKKVIIKQSNSATVIKGTKVNQSNSLNLSAEQLKNVKRIEQSNYIKEYSFNPFQPFEKHIQIQNYVIKIKNK